MNDKLVCLILNVLYSFLILVFFSVCFSGGLFLTSCFNSRFPLYLENFMITGALLRNIRTVFCGGDFLQNEWVIEMYPIGQIMILIDMFLIKCSF